MQSQVSNHSQMALTPEQKEQVCRLAAEGDTITTVTKKLGLKPWEISNERRNSPIFKREHDVAREIGMAVRVERMADVAMDPDIGPQRARVWCDAVKFQAEREYRRIWGASIDMAITQVPELAGTLLEARRRALPVSDQAQITDAQVTEYAVISDARTSDTESPATKPIPNPFD